MIPPTQTAESAGSAVMNYSLCVGSRGALLMIKGGESYHGDEGVDDKLWTRMRKIG